MKFSINKSELQNALSVVQKAASTRSTLPVLSGILIETQQDHLVLQATDLEFSIQYTVPALVEEDGRTVVPGKLFSDIVKNLADAAVRVTTTEGEANITCDTSSFSVRTLNPEDFPAFPQVETTDRIVVPFNLFTKMVKRVSRSVSKDESRAILTGVLVTMENNTLRMVSTDSYRLSVTEAEVEVAQPEAGAATETTDGENVQFEAVIAGNFLNEVAALPKTETEVAIALSENQIVVECGNTVFINRRIEGNYPNYKQLLPDSYTTRATIGVEDLAASVRRAALLSSSSSPMRFDLNIASQTTQITVASDEVGSAQETIVCEIEGEDVEIAFNSSYVLDGLAAVEGDKVLFDVQSVSRPGVFRAVGTENYLYLIMPVRI